VIDQVPVDDRGLTLGDGLFETILADRGRLVRFDRHLARLVQGCGVIGLAPPAPAEARTAALQALALAGLTDQRAAARLTWTAGSGGRGLDRPQPASPRLVASAAPAPASSQPLRLATAAIRRNETSPASRLKTLAYIDNVLARRAAREAGADEALMLNTAGEVACAAAANIFWIEAGRLFTPSLDCGVLAGIARATVLESAAGLGMAAAETRAGRAALAQAEAIFLTNSLMGPRGVCELDGQAFADHPMIGRLAQAWAAVV
jgi:branched-subunit amino acid aminotransferase/4-amino-4-deoxychorismate lyase